MVVHYKQKLAESAVSALLIEQGFAVAQSSSPKTGYQLVANKKDVTVHVRVRHLQFDEEFYDSPLAYQVYKIKAFPNGKYDPITLKDVDLIIGYNPNDHSFACVPPDIYESKQRGSARFYPHTHLRHEYFNSWDALDEFITSALLPS